MAGRARPALELDRFLGQVGQEPAWFAVAGPTEQCAGRSVGDEELVAARGNGDIGETPLFLQIFRVARIEATIGENLFLHAVRTTVENSSPWRVHGHQVGPPVRPSCVDRGDQVTRSRYWPRSGFSPACSASVSNSMIEPSNSCRLPRRASAWALSCSRSQRS